VQNLVAGLRNQLLVAEFVTFFNGGSKNMLFHLWLTKWGKKIGGWVEDPEFLFDE